MKIAVLFLVVGLSMLGSTLLLRSSRTTEPLASRSASRSTAIKSITFVPFQAPDCVLEVSAGPQTSLSAPVELNVTLANKGTAPIVYFVSAEAFTIVLRNLDEGQECTPTERGKGSFAAPRYGPVARNLSRELPPGETRAWSVDLREQFPLSAALYEADVGFRLQILNVGGVNVVSPPIQIKVD